jgi:hypothetical protein
LEQELDSADFDTDKFDGLMSSMMQGMRPAAEAVEAMQAPVTVESMCSELIPELWPGDETRELARANAETDGMLVIMTPKLFKDDLKVAGMFVDSWKKSAGDPKARRKAVWAIDKLMNTEAAMKLVADIENEVGNHEACKAIYAGQERLHADITVPVARGLIDEEIADTRHHLRQVLRHKQRGNHKAKQAAAQEAMQIINRVANIATVFASPEQSKILGEMVMKDSAFKAALATGMPSDPAGIEQVCETVKTQIQDCMRKAQDEMVPPSREV